jgi:hypothetical protein
MACLYLVMKSVAPQNIKANMETYLLSDKKIKTSAGLNLFWCCCPPPSDNIYSNDIDASFS